MMYYCILSVIFALVFCAVVFKTSPKIALWGGLAVFIVSAMLNFFALPIVALWGYGVVWAEVISVVLLAMAVVFFLNDIDNAKSNVNQFLVPSICIVLLLGCMMVSTCEGFHASEYQKMLKVTTVTDSTFNHEVSPISVEKMISVDETLAEKVAEDRLGEDLGLGSKVEIGNMTIQNITGEFVINDGKKLTFNNDLIWVAPLEHRSLWKWIVNDYTDGYVIVSATDATKIYLVTEVNGRPLKMKYIESGYMFDDIERHIKLNGYLSQGLTDHCLEISSEGRPYWVLCTYDKTIGFSGENSTGVVTVDPQTGEIAKYALNEVPDWIDRIQPEEFVENQIRCWGEYAKGWWNSWTSQTGVQDPTPGTTLVYSNGKSYWYTGIQSAGADKATNGFMLVDTRTKEAKFYRIAGMNETEAQNIAEDRPFAKASSYSADFPVLYNVKGYPTYFMTYKGSSGNVTGYCFVSVTNRQAVGCGASKKDAETEYLRMLKKSFNDKIVDGPVVTNNKTLVVRDIVNENNTYYILFEGVKGVEFSGSTEFYPELKWTHKGDTVSVSYGEGKDKVIVLDYFDNLNVEI